MSEDAYVDSIAEASVEWILARKETGDVFQALDFEVFRLLGNHFSREQNSLLVE